MAITHFIYELPGIKVGCTHDLEERKKWYPHHRIAFLKVLEELHDATDQLAAERERWWQDHLGYKRDKANYAQSLTNMTLEERKEAARNRGRSAAKAITPEQRLKWGKKGGQISVTKGSGIHAMTEEQLFEGKSRGGRIGGRIGNKAGKRVAGQKVGTIKARCPHCGLEANLGNLRRWHFNNCPNRA